MTKSRSSSSSSQSTQNRRIFSEHPPVIPFPSDQDSLNLSLPGVGQQTCIYHPQQLISHFCEGADCLMPLCKICTIYFSFISHLFLIDFTFISHIFHKYLKFFSYFFNLFMLIKVWEYTKRNTNKGATEANLTLSPTCKKGR